MYFIGTRGEGRVTAAEAVVRGLAADGGLFVPEYFPQLSAEECEGMLGMDYAERAALILGKFFDTFGKEELLSALKSAYSGFEGGDPAPLVRPDDGLYLLELFHGPTCACPDLSMAALPYLLRESLKELGWKTKPLILTATSGDAGKSALEYLGEYKNVVFYPEEGVSKMQKLQLCTQEGEGIDVCAVRGSTDDCVAGMKKLFAAEELSKELAAKGYFLTTASGANFGRLAGQIVCFFSAYCDLVASRQIKWGDAVDICVAAGDLGNLLAAYYAKKMGLPLGMLLGASNKNCTFTDLWKHGTFNRNRPLFRTMSPSLDLLVPSDLERLIFELSGRQGALTKERMAQAAATGKFSLRTEELAALKHEIFAGATSEDDTVECVYEFFEELGYPMDPHTGVAMNVARKYTRSLPEDAPRHPMVVVATASPYKFPQDVLYALTGNDVKDSYKGIKRVHLLTAMKVPESLKAIRYKPILFKTVVPPDKMLQEVKRSIV